MPFGVFLPALAIELESNRSVDSAIEQIKEKRYPEILQKYGEKILLVEINYDTKTQKHCCIIEEFQ